MNAVLMDRVEIGDECVIGALTLVPSEMRVPARKVVVGNPGRIVKDVTDEMVAWKTDGTRLYQTLPKRLHETLKPCEPLREVPAHRAAPQGISQSYRTWHETRDS
jgi:carbonic anhydrase/acetyltransferase-like protein (isoleucine patch superfamily)